MVLQFFDNDGCPLIFHANSDNVFETDIYLEPVSVSLYENFNIYLMEKYDSDGSDAYRFPILDSNVRYLFRWAAEDDEIPEYFLYDIKHDDKDNSYFIDKQLKEYLFEYVDRNIRSPFQINVGFSPTSEIIYRKSLMVIKEELNSNNEIDQTLEYQINFYSEGIEEDPRFKIQLENFGIKLNKTDALAIKDYNVSEAYPDWEIVNNVRKHLILEKEELVPYLGTYRCLKNIIALFGYGDSIDVREYYKNVNPSSEYFGKYSIVSISDYLDNGKVDEMNLVNKNITVRDNSDFQKCGMLALAYEFNKPSGSYDENGIPILESNSDFTVNEMFFKLHKMKNILERDYLPVNVFICDVIGEWSYYISFTKYVWADKLEIKTLNLNDKITLSMYPEVNHHIYDVSMLHTKRYSDSDIDSELPDYIPNDYYEYNKTIEGDFSKKSIDLPIKSINSNKIPSGINKTSFKTDNFDGGEMITISEQTGIPVISNNLTDSKISSLCSAIESFYSEYQSKSFDSIYDKSYDYVNSYNNPIGFPVILKVNLTGITYNDVKFIRICDFGVEEDGNRKTYEDLYFKNYVDIEWHIKYNSPVDRKNDVYDFKYTGSIRKAYKLPQLLPYTGSYDVSAKITNVFGGASYVYYDNFIVVEDSTPQIIATYPGDDIFEYSINNLKYVSYSDFGANRYELPRVNILDNFTESDVVLDPNEIASSEIVSYVKDTEIYNPNTGEWETIEMSDNQNADNFGFGDYKALKYSDFKGARVVDMFHVRPVDCVLSNDILFGFWFSGEFNKTDNKICYRNGVRRTTLYPNETETEELIDLWYTLPSGTAEEVCKQMNSGNDDKLPFQLRRFTYYPVELNNMDKGSYDGISDSDIDNGITIIVAEAKELSNNLAMKLSYSGLIGSKFTFNKPFIGFDKSINIVDFYPELLTTAISMNDITDTNYNNPQDRVLTDYYLMDHGYVCYDSTIEDDTKKRGYIPVILHENLINQNTCKMHIDSFSIPVFKRVIFFVGNIVSKKSDSFVWTLKDIYGNVVLIVRKNPYFIYNFNETGNYELDVTLKDNNNNVSTICMTRFINVVGREDYLDIVQNKLMNKQNK